MQTMRTLPRVSISSDWTLVTTNSNPGRFNFPLSLQLGAQGQDWTAAGENKLFGGVVEDTQRNGVETEKEEFNL